MHVSHESETLKFDLLLRSTEQDGLQYTSFDTRN